MMVIFSITLLILLYNNRYKYVNMSRYKVEYITELYVELERKKRNERNRTDHWWGIR